MVFENRRQRDLFDEKVNEEFDNILDLIGEQTSKEDWEADLGIRVDMLLKSVFGEGDYLKKALAKRLKEIAEEVKEL